MDDPKQIDLPRTEWESTKKNPNEPIFGPGLIPFIFNLIGMVVMFFVYHWLRYAIFNR